LLLGLAGTLGVAAFVAIPTVAVMISGFSLRPHFAVRDPDVRKLLALGSWATLQHAAAALLLGAAIVVGGGVAGGVVAFQIGWFFFLAPYGVVAQPIQTAVLPELVLSLEVAGHEGFGELLRWAFGQTAVLLLPLSAAFVAFAAPAADIVAFGSARDGNGVQLIATAFASLGAGILAYGIYLLYARAFFTLGDSRTPALVSVVVAIVGAVTMIAIGRKVSGTARVAVLGVVHVGAFTVAAVVLALMLWRRTGQSVWSGLAIPATALAVVMGAGAWWVVHTISPAGRTGTTVLLIVTAGIVGVVYLAIARALGWLRPRPVLRDLEVTS
jgi:putative peptidoglycan lipid II flippase